MGDWVPLNPGRIAFPQHEKLRGVDITFIISPYDIPEAVRGEYHEDLRNLLLNFDI